MTVIFPIGVKHLNSMSALLYLMPVNSLNLAFNSSYMKRLCPTNRIVTHPNVAFGKHLTFPLFQFYFQSKSILCCSKIISVACNDLEVPSKIIVVSANCVSLYILLPILIPVISGEFLIKHPKTSATSKKRYRGMGSPCLHPLSIGIGFNKKPHCVTNAFISLLKSLIHLNEVIIKPKPLKYSIQEVPRNRIKNLLKIDLH